MTPGVPPDGGVMTTIASTVSGVGVKVGASVRVGSVTGWAICVATSAALHPSATTIRSASGRNTFRRAWRRFCAMAACADRRSCATLEKGGVSAEAEFGDWESGLRCNPCVRRSRCERLNQATSCRTSGGWREPVLQGQSSVPLKIRGVPHACAGSGCGINACRTLDLEECGMPCWRNALCSIGDPLTRRTSLQSIA
jgi:hypothetical protein